MGAADDAVGAATEFEDTATGVTVRYYVETGQEISADETYILERDRGRNCSVLPTP